MNNTEIRNLDDQALVVAGLTAERELVELRFAHSLNQLDNTATLGDIRRRIARIRTEARRRELEKGLGKDSLFRQHRASFHTDATEAPAESASAAKKGSFLSGIVDKISGNE